MGNFITDMLNKKVQQLENDAARWAYVRDVFVQGGTKNITELVDRFRATLSDATPPQEMILLTKDEAVSTVCAMEFKDSEGQAYLSDLALARKIREHFGFSPNEYLTHPTDER